MAANQSYYYGETFLNPTFGFLGPFFPSLYLLFFVITCMKIAILNDCQFTHQHLSRLRELGEVAIFEDTTSESDAIKRLNGVDIAIVDQFLVPYNQKVLESASNLKLLVLNTTSFSMVDLNVAKAKGIMVTNVPGYSTQAVAELAIGLMFAVNRKMAVGDREFRQKPFEVDLGNKEQQRYCGFDLKGKTLGVIGLGKIGKAVGEMALGLGMSVVYTNRSPQSVSQMKSLSLDELLTASDVVVMTAPLNDSTKGLIGKDQLAKMKKSAIFINISPGKVFDTEALFEALKNNQIGGAGLDIVAGLTENHPLLKLENVVFTPHVGFYTKESMANLPAMIMDDVESFLKGKPVNIVNQ